MADYHIREAAETLLSSVSSPPYRTLSHSQSVNLVSEDLVAGHRPQGNMSSIRRFFCLFVTFDLLFTSLMWLICVVMKGETVVQIFDREIVHYDIKVSLFDIVIAAVLRFLVLLLFYAILYINNWIVIAISTSFTCAFLIGKVFVYDWPDASQPVFQVFLILTSFTLSWVEAWFLDFRVLPQELQAKQIIEAIVHHSATERTPLLAGPTNRHLRPQSTHGESTVNWFSPVETPESSPRPRKPGEQVILTQDQNFEVSVSKKLQMASNSVTNTENVEIDEQEFDKHMGELENVGTEEELEKKLNNMSIFGFSIAKFMKAIFNRDNSGPFHAEWLSIDEYTQMAEKSMENAFRTIHLGGWKLEKRGSHRGDLVESVHTEEFGKVYRLTALVDCPAKFLYQEFKDNLTKLPEWNPTILKSEMIKEVGPGIDLSYQVTAGGGRGIIAARDFIILRRNAALSRDGRPVDGDAQPYGYIASGVSVSVPGYPPFRDYVRGHNKVGCWFLRAKMVEVGGKTEEKTVFQWLMCCDLKGKIPQFVLDAAFATVMLDYIVHVRKFVTESRAKGLI